MLKTIALYTSFDASFISYKLCDAERRRTAKFKTCEQIKGIYRFFLPFANEKKKETNPKVFYISKNFNN